MASALLETLAGLLEYPRPDLPERLARLERDLAAAAGPVPPALAAFVASARAHRREALEESWTRAFDFNPDGALELGWHLFGEQYERGTFLVAVRERLRRAGIEEGTELPDHLATVLRLLARLEPDEGAALAADYVLPALAKLCAGLEREGKERAPWADLLRAVREAVERVRDARPSPEAVR